MRNMIRTLVGILVLASVYAQAGIIANYPFTSGSTTNFASHPNVTVTSITASPSLTITPVATGGAEPGAGYLEIKQNAITSSQELAKYVTFTVTVSSNMVMNLSSLTLHASILDANANKSGFFAVSSSVLGHTHNIDVRTIPSGTTWTSYTIDLSGSSYQDLSGPVVFRLYGWYDKSSATSINFDNITLNGVAVVPEPIHIALGAFGLIFAGVRVRRYVLDRRERS
jgi:hypothetical protein